MPQIHFSRWKKETNPNIEEIVKGPHGQTFSNHMNDKRSVQCGALPTPAVCPIPKKQRRMNGGGGGGV